MAQSDKYKRGSSGYSKQDEKDAKNYRDTNRANSPKDFSEAKKDASVGNAEYSWKSNTKSEEGRAINAANQAYTNSETVRRKQKEAADGKGRLTVKDKKY